MSRPAEWSRDARRDLLDIYEFIATERQERAAARRLIHAIREKADAYARQPGMGTIHDEVEIPGVGGPVRSFRVKTYLAYYLELPDGILVLRVAHGRRDSASLFRA